MALIAVGHQGEILGRSRCASLLGNLEFQIGKLMLSCPSFFIHLQIVVSLKICLEIERPYHGAYRLWLTEDDFMFAGSDGLPEGGFLESSFVQYVGSDSGSICYRQVLRCLLGM